VAVADIEDVTALERKVIEPLDEAIGEASACH